MAPEHPIALLIPWYANGSLDEEEREGVARHLEACDACRALLDEARALSGLARESADVLLDHVQAQHLDRLARDPDSGDADLAWSREHVRGCDACRAALRILEGIPESPPVAPPVAVRGEVGPKLRSWLGRTILHPAAAAAYLVALALLAPLAYLQIAREPRGVPPSPAPAALDGVVEVTVLAGPLRGPGGVERVTLAPDRPFVALGAAFDLPRGFAGSVTISVRGPDGDVAWSTDLEGERAAAALASAGFVTILVPTNTMSPGTFRLLAERVDDRAARPLLDAPFEAVRAP